MIGVILGLTVTASSWAQAPPTTRVLDCTTGGCHATTMDHKVLHGPTAVQACETCHEYADPAKHTFVLKRQGRELCDFCHIDKVGTEGPVVHDPVAKGDCLSCHNPHGAEDRRLMRKGTLRELCADCHQETLQGAHLHAPVADGRCTDCHSPHTAAHPGLLPKPRQELCLSCHAGTEHQIEGSPFAHAPVLRDCLECHTAHASDVAKQLKAAPRVLCTTCHQDIGAVAAGAAHKHSAVLDDRACLNCHTPHGGEREGLMPENAAAMCLACHKGEIKAADGKHRVAGVPELTARAFIPHGPNRQGDCAACHDVHGGDSAKFLVAEYTDSFYRKFDVGAYALCFKCHEDDLARDESTTERTGFRDGSRNLHYVHVAKGSNGRSCRACHTAHASSTPAQIADSVQYGQWRIPLNFAKTETGGSCAPGCHKAARYDRENPVGSPAVGPSAPGDAGASAGAARPAPARPSP